MFAFDRWLCLSPRPGAAFWVAILLVGALAGCEVPQPPPTQADGAAPEPRYVDPNSEEGQRLAQAQAQAQAKAVGQADLGRLTAPARQSNESKETAAKSGRLVEAKSGVGKWKPYRPGIVTTALNAYFSTRQRMGFNQVIHGLKTFRAQHGRKPKDFAEVEKEIIKPAGVKLPELQEGDEYVYVPDEGPDGTLMVMRRDPQKE